MPAPAWSSITQLKRSASGWLPLAGVAQFWHADVYEVRRPVLANGRPLATISVGVTTALVAERLHRLLMLVLGMAVADTLAAWFLVSLVTGRISVRLAQIVDSYQALAGGAGGSAIEVNPRDEIDTLTDKFNELSQRVRTERTQLATRDHLFDVVRSMRDAIIMLDGSGSILFANVRACETLGLAIDKVEGIALSSVLGEAHSLVGLTVSAMATGAEARDVTVELPGEVSYLATFFKLGRGRNPAGLLILLRDLRPVIELETALDYANRLARLGALISGVAHQLRSPLQSLNLRLELLSNDGASEASERHIERLRQEIHRLDESVEALLRFMRPEDLKVSDFDLNRLLRELGARVRDERVNLEYRLDQALPPVHGDRAMLSEALSNVITNAVQAMPEGGALILTSKMTGAGIEVAITDTGIGIEREHLKQIFDLYYTTKPQGGGLGLSLALRAVELNRGTIVIESQVAEGTTCRINLPIGKAAAPQDAPSNAA
jgi:signal transduction histidine kinase